MADNENYTEDENYSDDAWNFDDDESAKVENAPDPRSDESHEQHGDWLTEQSWTDYETEQRKRLDARMAAERQAHHAGAAQWKRAQKEAQQREQLVSAGLQGNQTPGAQEAAVDVLYAKAEAGQISETELHSELRRIGAMTPAPTTPAFFSGSSK